MRVRALFLSSVALVALTAMAEAQCFTPDNLGSAPCCNPVPLNIPTGFPAFTLPAQGICWDDCAVATQTCNVVSLPPPTPTLICGEYTTPLDVFDCAGNSILKGTLVLDYSRTWMEDLFPGGPEHQVWRFMAKIDMEKTSTAPAACPVPVCLDTQPKCFFYGYVDYAFHCVSGAWESALVLYHGCDEFQHRPGLSSVPGSFHATQTVAIVAPDTAANPFVPVLIPPVGGVPVGEAVRSMPPVGSGTCLAEDPLLQGAFQPFGQACMCPVMPQPPQNTAFRMSGSAACGNNFFSLNLYPLVPWYEVIATSLGTWTTGATYPGPEAAWALEGLIWYNDACDTTGVIVKKIDVFYGAITERGYGTIPNPLSPVTQNFADLASNYSHTLGSPPPFPILGAVGPTDHLIYMSY